MKKIHSLFLSMTLLSGISLASCSFIPLTRSSVPGISKTAESSKEKSYADSFINTSGLKRILAINHQTLTLIPGLNTKFYADVIGEDETPTFSDYVTISSLTWVSDDPEIATIDENGLLTAVKPGQTRISARLFESQNIRAYCEVNIIARQLESVSIENARKTFLVDTEFVPTFRLIAHYVGGFTEEVTPTAIDSSAIRMNTLGDYEVKASYTLDGVTKETSYTAHVIESASYDPKKLSYTYSDTYSNQANGWYNPTKGDVKGLVVPIYFTDSDKWVEDKSAVLASIEKAYFGEAGEGGWNSVASYYKQASKNTLNLTGKVSSWYEPGVDSNYIKDDLSKWNELVRGAFDWYFENNPTEKPADYDSDSNGWLDYFSVVYGCDAEANEISTYWPKVSSQTNFYPGKGGQPGFSHFLMTGVDSFKTDIAHSPVDSHTIIHETGHTFGLFDYYDYSDADFRPVGGSTMMFHTTHQQDPFSTIALGWGEPIVPETSCTLELGDFQSTHNAILLSPTPEEVDSPFDEYILLELYAPNGLNEYDSTYAWQGFYSKGPTEPGIRIWHVNGTFFYTEGGETVFTTDPTISGARDAFTNSFGENHGSRLGSDYYDRCLLFEIRNDKAINYLPTIDDEAVMTKDSTLFHSGDTFSLSEFSKQFINGTKLDSGVDLGWEVSVESIAPSEGSGYRATINLTRTA